ncbi:alpha/beta hydrolase [Amorphus sp. 3PC139-8]|uniref:alpha/beta hydrolase n=1 Tax=Amorphus sp. 3PC139-8 TaxID=2735676 RepID=UPI00345D692D
METDKASSLPADLLRELADIGPRWAEDVSSHVRQMARAFGPLLAAAPKVSRIERDQAYGPHPRHRLDVYHPDIGAPMRGPALVFVHGGAFVQGDRNSTDEIYANVMHRFARSGIVGINVEYRLAPEATFPGASEDVAAAIAWTRANAERLGVDADRIVLMGHSAGAAHAASYAYDRRLHPAEGPGLAGLIVVSGRVRADTAPDNPNAAKVETYYGSSDPAILDAASAVSHVDAGSPPTFIAYAEYENPLLDVYCLELAYRLAAAKRRAPPVVRLAGHNHTSIIAHINTSEDRLAQAILAFIAGLK